MELNKIRKKLKLIREAKGITQNELARKLKKPQSTVSRFEREKTDCNYSLVNDYCKALGEDLMSVLAYDQIEYRNVYYSQVRCEQCDKPVGFSKHDMDYLCNLCNDQNRAFNKKHEIN
jgi:predicted transcriptional regulator